MKKYNSVTDMKNNSTRSSCSNGTESIIHPETILHNIKKLFSEYGSTLHCQSTEYAKRIIVPEYCDNGKKCDQCTLNESSKCKGVSKKGTRIFDTLHSAVNENKCNLSSRHANNLGNDFPVSSNKNNNSKLKAYRFISDDFCPFCQKVPHKHTLKKINYEDYISEERGRKYKQFNNIPEKTNEITTCYLRIPKKYLLKNQGFTQKNITLNLDDNNEEYNIIINKNSLLVGKENTREVNRNNVTLNCTTKHTNNSNSGQSAKMNNWLEQNIMYNETFGNDSECHFQQRNKNWDLNCKHCKKEHINESISVSYSTVKINYHIAPLLLMAYSVSRQILRTAIINYETCILYSLINKYATMKPLRMPATQDVSISCQLDNVTISQSLTYQNNSLECPKNKSDYSEFPQNTNNNSLECPKNKSDYSEFPQNTNNNSLECPKNKSDYSEFPQNTNNNAQTSFDSRSKSIIATNIYHAKNYQIRNQDKKEGRDNIQQQSIKVDDCDEICPEKGQFSSVLSQSHKITKNIIDVGLNNYENYFRLGIYSMEFNKEDLKTKTVHDASVSCNLVSDIESEMMYLNTLLFKGMKQDFLDIFEISRKLKSSASEILGALNNFTKIPKLPYEDKTETGIHSHIASKESVTPVSSKIESSQKLNNKKTFPNTEVKFKSNKFFNNVSNHIPLPNENVNIASPSFIDKFHENQDWTVDSQENEEIINHNNYDNYEERISEQEPTEQYNDIKQSLVITDIDKEAICSQQLHGEFNNRQKNRLRKWEYYCSKPSLQARNCFSEGCISTSRSLPVQGSQPHKILWCLTRVTSYVNGSRTYEFIDKMQLATPNSIGDNTTEQEPEIPNMVVVMSHYDDSNESLVNHASSSQNL